MATNPAEALQTYRKAFALSSELSSADTLNIHHRSSLADALLGIGQALHRLHKNDEAIQNLADALDLEKSIQAVAPERIFLLRTLSRTYMEMGNVLLDQGDAPRALENYSQGLAIAEKSLKLVPTSLNHDLDRGDLLQAQGRYYLTLASKPGMTHARRSQLRGEASLIFSERARDLAGLGSSQSGYALCGPERNAGACRSCCLRSALILQSESL